MGVSINVKSSSGHSFKVSGTPVSVDLMGRQYRFLRYTNQSGAMTIFHFSSGLRVTVVDRTVVDSLKQDRGFDDDQCLKGVIHSICVKNGVEAVCDQLDRAPVINGVLGCVA